MFMERIVLNNRKYIIYSCHKPEKIIFVMLDKSDEQSAGEIYNSICQRYSNNNNNNDCNDDIHETDVIKRNVMLIFCMVDNWNNDLSPWKAPAVFGTEDFGGESQSTLNNITDICIPYLIKSYNIDITVAGFFICGYSLAGLFSLWAIYNATIFKGAVSCSGSLWFNGFKEYIKSQTLPEDCSIYLSLGDREHKTKNPIMSTVKSITEQIYNLYQTTPEVKNLKLEWNKGNHFNNPDERLQKGILWIIENAL